MGKTPERLARNARITLEAGCRLKPGETLLILTRRTDHRYAPAREVERTVEALQAAAAEMGARPAVEDLTEHWTSGEYQKGVLLGPLRAAMESAGVVLNTMDDVSFSRLLGRKDNDDEFLTSGRRWLFLQHSGMDRWDLRAEAVAAIRPRTESLLQWLGACREVRVTTPAGTDFRFEMGPGSNATPILGIVPLYGEVAIAPRQGSESGLLVIDGPSQMGVRPAGELDRQPLRIEVAGGQARRWSGEAQQVARLEAFLAVGDPRPDAIDEVGIPTSRVMDNDRYWWRDGTHHLERVHIALGNNLRRESRVHGARHMDLEVDRPTIRLDGRTILEDARFVGPLAG
jgi:hypothetical protein